MLSPHFFLITGIICAIIALIGGVWWWFSLKQLNYSDTDLVTIRFPKGTIIAEVSTSILKHAAGLSARPSLATDTGMLFIFSSPQKPTFWMKGMKFPLDFVWLKNGIVIDVNQNISVPQNLFDFNLVSPSQKVDMVLEVNVGTIEKMGIKVGDVVSIKK